MHHLVPDKAGQALLQVATVTTHPGSWARRGMPQLSAAAAATTTQAMMGTMTNMEAAATVATANALISNEQTARALATTL